MSLKRRNAVAWVLLMAAALCVTAGLGIAGGLAVFGGAWNAVETTMPQEAGTFVQMETDENGEWTAVQSGEYGPTCGSYEQPSRSGRLAEFGGYALALFGAAMGLLGVFVLARQEALLGPDGACLLLGFCCAGWIQTVMRPGIVPGFWLTTLLLFLFLAAVRELWGWILAKFYHNWCFIQRLAVRSDNPALTLALYLGDTMVMALGAAYILAALKPEYRWLAVFPALSCLLGIRCLWALGVELTHLRQQLDHFQNGSPIQVKPGAFAQTEEQLVRLQTQHQQAIQTAVTSERFKVELIANVSHDLRTPLTAIVGYGELLKQEPLSPEGRRQLDRLNQKAAYMGEMVESLFELTKVSSGVVECRKEEIDLIRLLEQTIGLFDDQLTQAGLAVRRHYEKDAMPLVTDGRRMHQVFANLLGNAIKYALPGTRIHLEAKEGEKSYLVRMVNTASYEMDFRPEEILQRFARGNKARTTQGSGLGLAIAQTYTESVGGAFRVAIDGDQFSALVELPKTERNL